MLNLMHEIPALFPIHISLFFGPFEVEVTPVGWLESILLSFQ